MILVGDIHVAGAWSNVNRIYSGNSFITRKINNPETEKQGSATVIALRFAAFLVCKHHVVEHCLVQTWLLWLPQVYLKRIYPSAWHYQDLSNKVLPQNSKARNKVWCLNLVSRFQLFVLFLTSWLVTASMGSDLKVVFLLRLIPH